MPGERTRLAQNPRKSVLKSGHSASQLEIVGGTPTMAREMRAFPKHFHIAGEQLEEPKKNIKKIKNSSCFFSETYLVVGLDRKK